MQTLETSLLTHYRAMRDNGLGAGMALTQARYALQADQTRSEFQALEKEGKVRLTKEADDWMSLDDLMGDCFNPDANPSVNPNKLEREKEEFLARVERDGVWGIKGEYFNGTSWIETDAVWGFVGDDWHRSGYDTDIMRATLDAYHKQTYCPCCRQPMPEA